MASIWSETVSLPRFAALDRDLKTDVLIIGGGIAGLLCAHALREAGADYALVEADRICGGVTKNTTAKITSQHGAIFHRMLRRYGADLTGRYLGANEVALRKYRDLCGSVDCDFEERDAYVYSRTDRDLLAREYEALKKVGYPAEWAETTSLPFSVVGAIRFPRQAQFHPLKFLGAIAKDLRVFEETKVRELRGMTAVTERFEIRAKKIIVATHFPFLNKHGLYFLKMHQHRSYVIALENADPVDGMYIDAAQNGLSFRTAGDLLLLGGGGHRTGKTGGGWRELEAFAKRKYPNAAISYRWATQDCVTLDDIPYIGRYSPTTPDLLVATGFGKWGMTTAMVAADVLADLVAGRENPYTKLFLPSRSVLHPQLAINAGEATVDLLRPTAPRCPHLGCALRWNADERSWDCPCHGSRFSEDGNLIDNPATADLDLHSPR